MYLLTYLLISVTGKEYSGLVSHFSCDILGGSEKSSTGKNVISQQTTEIFYQEFNFQDFLQSNSVLWFGIDFL